MARIAVSAMFYVCGLATGAWVSRIPAIQDRLDLSSGALGLALASCTVGNLVAMPTVSYLTTRWGSEKVTLSGAILFSVSLILPGLASTYAALVAALFVFGFGMALLDIAMNAQAVVVERRFARPIMSSVHGLWSIGGMSGAAGGGLAAAAGWAPLPQFAFTSVIMTLIGLAAARWLIPDPPSSANHTGVEVAIGRPQRALLGLGVLAFCGMLNEGAVSDWSAIYLKRTVGTSETLAAMGYSAFAGFMAGGRLLGDMAARWLGSVRIVRLGGMMSVFGLGMALMFPHPFVVIAGFSLVGLGMATVVPLVYSAAGNIPGVPAGPALAGVATTGYMAFLSGPPVIGFMAELVTLRGALILVVVLSLAIFALAPAVQPPSTVTESVSELVGS